MSVVFSVTYNLPKYFEMKIGTSEDIVDNVTVILPEIQPTGEKLCHFRGENVFDLHVILVWSAEYLVQGDGIPGLATLLSDLVDLD